MIKFLVVSWQNLLIRIFDLLLVLRKSLFLQQLEILVLVGLGWF